MGTRKNNHIERQLRAVGAILIASYFGACAPVKFDTVPAGKGGEVVTRCEGTQCFYDVTEEKTVGEGLVDILIVNDNSGSMSFEQSKMATAFAGFLTSINTLDYRIAMTTTDVSSPAGTNPGAMNYNPAGPYNGNGSLQDGRLIEFSPGLKFLDRSTYNKDTLFNATIKRPETLQCETSGFTQCASGDERGIVAAGLSVKNYSGQFMRQGAHLAIIMLGDEDERGVSKYNPCNYVNLADKNNCEAIKAAYPFSADDEPQAFVDTVRGLFPSKTMTWHSIIVKPGDIACRTAQTGQVPAPMPVLGQEGYALAKVSQLTGGKIGDICASNYTTQLQDIGYAIKDQVTSLPFRCRPVNDQFTVTFNGTPAPASEYSADFSTMVLTIKPTLLTPQTKVTLKYTCTK